MFISGFPLRLAALTAAVLLVAPAAAAQPVLFVDADATGAADGSSWADAFPDLQQALAIAEAGDEVWVAEGTYRPTDGTDRDASFVLVSGVGLYGGFDGSEATRAERDVEAHVTVLSGEIGDPDEVSDNAYHVVVASGADGSTVLDGFTVTAGFGNGVNPRNRGGGIYAENSSLVVRDCRIVANAVVQTDGFGGGSGAFFGTTGAPRFERVAFERNGVGIAIGGGLWLYDADGAGRASSGAGASAVTAETLEEALVREIQWERREEVPGGSPGGAPDKGGSDLSATLYDVRFAENAARFGGGIRSTNANLDVVEAVFERNMASSTGGGLWLSGGEGHLVNVVFYGNVVNPEEPTSIGAGIYASTGSVITLTNVTLIGNTARLGGGLTQSGGTSGVLTNVNFAANEADEGGAIFAASGAEAEIRNAVLWGNGEEVGFQSSTAILSHVLIEGGCPPEDAVCESVLDADPLFARAPSPGADSTWGTPDDDYGDLRLQAGSPALDFGLTSFLPPDTFDLDADGDTEEPLPFDLTGEPRVVGEAVDLGAYEGAVPVAAYAEPVASALTLDVYPNPTRGPVAVALSLTRSQRATVEVFDALGRRVVVLHAGPLAAGTHVLRLATAPLPSGIYLLRLRGEAVSLTRRLVVLR